MRWKRWISVTPLAMIAAAPVVTWFALPSVTVAADDTDAITRLSGIVNAGPSAVSSDDRDVAAIQLVNRDTPAARAAVQAALKNNANTSAQTSIAKALSLAQHPSETLIPALADSLGPNPGLTEAAASALANYPGNAGALQRLTKFIDNTANPEPARELVIHALGQSIDPPAADYLLNKLLGPQPKQTDAAAFAALAEMAGQPEFGTDRKQWNQWWDSMRLKTPDQFRAALLEARARQFKLLKQRNQLLAESTRKLLISNYGAVPASSKPDLLMAYLNDPAPEVRSVGVTLEHLDSVRKAPSKEVRQRLLQLIGDRDEKVRSDVVNLLLTLNDPASAHALIDQLGIEKDPQVAQTIAQILGNLKDPALASDAASALMPMLHDANLDNAIAAAKALAGLGQNVHLKDPKLAVNLSDQIRALLKSIDNQPGTNALRAACVSALAELRDPKSLDTFRDCFHAGETIEVRRAALTGMGNLGDTNANQMVVERLSDPDATIRLEAARALTTVATPDQDLIIHDSMIKERDPEVSRALWIAFRSLYDKETPGQLVLWAAKFDNDPEKKIVTLEKLGELLKRTKDAQQYAYNEQKIADVMMTLKPPQVTEAIAHLQSALDYWRGPGKGTGGSDENLEQLVQQMLNDKLAAEQWGPACTFAAEQIAINAVYQESVGPRIRDKIDELIKASNTTAAQKLIDAAMAMKPSLIPKYYNDIQRAQNELKDRPPGP